MKLTPQTNSRTCRDLFPIHAGMYSSGISPECTHECLRRFRRDIKLDWLLNSTPEHQVYIDHISISEHLVSFSEFELFADATGYRTEAEIDGWGWIWHNGWIKEPLVNWRRPFRGAGNEIYTANALLAPVLQVSWNDADAYCRWRAMSEPGCRLPREAEWETYARMNGLSSIEKITTNPQIALYNDAIYMKDILMTLSGSPPSSSLSLVWEWVQEWYDAYPDGPSHNEFGDTYKVMRGGSLRSHAVQRTSDFRFRRCPTARSSFYGFRCAFDL